MGKFTVRDLLGVMEETERVCIDIPGKYFEVREVGEMLQIIGPCVLDLKVSGVWRSVYDKIVIEAGC